MSDVRLDWKGSIGKNFLFSIYPDTKLQINACMYICGPSYALLFTAGATGQRQSDQQYAHLPQLMPKSWFTTHP